jgi:hypothetical protein
MVRDGLAVAKLRVQVTDLITQLSNCQNASLFIHLHATISERCQDIEQILPTHFTETEYN